MPTSGLQKFSKYFAKQYNIFPPKHEPKGLNLGEKKRDMAVDHVFDECLHDFNLYCS